MYVVTGVSGRTGAAAAHTLIEAGEPVRVVVRDAAQGTPWAALGAEVAVADLTNVPALTTALAGARGAYLLIPPGYTTADPLAHGQAMADAIAVAVAAARLPKLVGLSSIGADRPDRTGLILVNHALEQRLGRTGVPTTFLRAAYFMENWGAVAGVAAAQGVLPSLLQPLDRAIPMVATADIGRVAAEALREDWTGIRSIALEGPTAYSPNDIAAAFARVLGKPVQAVAIPEAGWAEALSQGDFSPAAVAGFVELIQGLNSGHIAFTSDPAVELRRGRVTVDTVVATLAQATA